ncbi:hypothetical protein ACIQMV_37915 [Streptomyces sp. NPDC091412]|uniref:hypothetical protein n=1 Tax=Streptomyces sp. NPDC091412 TaxID=3366002 RepID=UPI003814BB40
MAEEFLDHDEFDALFQEQGGGGGGSREADAAGGGLVEERGEGAGEVVRVDRSALLSGDHVPAALSRGPYCLSFALPHSVVELQRLEAEGGEGDGAFGGPGLGGKCGESDRAGALQCAADGGDASVEVEVLPSQAEEFALA